jgi:hypothetical protein
MIVFHPARRSLRELFIKWDRHIEHFINMARGKPRWQIYWIARAVAILASPVFDWATIVSSNRISGISARFKAFLVLVAVRLYRAWKMLSLLPGSRGVAWNRCKQANDPGRI